MNYETPEEVENRIRGRLEQLYCRAMYQDGIAVVMDAIYLDAYWVGMGVQESEEGLLAGISWITESLTRHESFEEAYEQFIKLWKDRAGRLEDYVRSN